MRTGGEQVIVDPPLAEVRGRIPSRKKMACVDNLDGMLVDDTSHVD